MAGPAKDYYPAPSEALKQHLPATSRQLAAAIVPIGGSPNDRSGTEIGGAAITV